MKYWIIVNGAQLGPMELSELLALNPRPETPVWHEGLDDWVSAAAVPEIAEAFVQASMPEVPVDRPHEGAYERGYNKGYEEGRRAAQAAQANPQAAYQAGMDNAARFYSRIDPAVANFGPDPVCPPTYLWGAILVTIFCCQPVGIVAIVYSLLVRSRFNSRDYAGAENASNTAMWAVIISLVLGLVTWPFAFIAMAL